MSNTLQKMLKFELYNFLVGYKETILKQQLKPEKIKNSERKWKRNHNWDNALSSRVLHAFTLQQSTGRRSMFYCQNLVARLLESAKILRMWELTSIATPTVCAHRSERNTRKTAMSIKGFAVEYNHCDAVVGGYRRRNQLKDDSGIQGARSHLLRARLQAADVTRWVGQ